MTGDGRNLLTAFGFEKLSAWCRVDRGWAAFSTGRSITCGRSSQPSLPVDTVPSCVKGGGTESFAKCSVQDRVQADVSAVAQFKQECSNRSRVDDCLNI